MKIPNNNELLYTIKDTSIFDIIGSIGKPIYLNNNNNNDNNNNNNNYILTTSILSEPASFYEAMNYSEKYE